MKVTSFRTATTAASMYVDGYANDIIRMRLKPDAEWVWEVPEVIVAKPLNEYSLVVNPGDGAPRQSITNGAATLSVIVTKDDLKFSYRFKGQEVVSGFVELRNVESPAVEMRFPEGKYLYGVPEHTQNLSMKKNEKYELFNTDAFEYPLYSGEAKYGCIPFLMGHSTTATAGVLFLNSSEMLVRVLGDEGAPGVHWTAEVGITDLFFIPGPTPRAVQQHHAYLTGPTFFPPYCILGYHQCRWNYVSSDECIAVDKAMSGNDMPYDVLWLDIEHSDNKKYFSWDHQYFPDPQGLIDYLVENGRRLVTIKDPHTKYEKGFAVFDEGISGNHFVMNPDDRTPFEGECWPGNSCWPDFLQRRTREWYATFFHDDRCECGGRNVYTWVDMNEPAVFKGYRLRTMMKEALHHTDDGRAVQHRYLHNLYGFLSVLSAQKGCLEAAGADVEPERPFVLTRSFFAGSQRLVGMWAGDNMARWDHLECTSAELLGLSISNYPFCGVDAGGFMGEPTEELYVRWFQAAIFYPFFRGHSNMDTRHREPYVWASDARRRLRDALYLRYALIPYLYTVLYNAHSVGETVIRPLFYEFPGEDEVAEVQSTYMFGPSMLVCPVVGKGATSVMVDFPASAEWYAFSDGAKVSKKGRQQINVTMDSIPVYLRGGHVLPTKDKHRPSTALAVNDPFTLHVALDANGESRGTLYLDDGKTFKYAKGVFAHRSFHYAKGQLTCCVAAPGTYSTPNAVERVVLYGLPSTIQSATVDGIDLKLDHRKDRVVVDCRAASLRADTDWTILLQ